MASAPDSGHAKNVANFEKLISLCKSYEGYNPSRPALQVDNLEAALLKAGEALKAVKNTKASFDTFTNNRREGFTNLKKTAMQVVSAFSSSDVSDLAIEDARGIFRKIQGKRAKPIKPDDTPAAKPEQDPAQAKNENHNSASQTSYDLLVDHFDKLVETVLQQPNYNPNEPQLSRDGVQEQLKKYKALNTAVVESTTALHNARILRSTSLYNTPNGIVPLAADVKQYVKSVFTTLSPQYKKLTGLRFDMLQ